ncbi:nucleotidyltransferase family protein [Granulicella arctica]|uniref:nucleotidyltransferase family protein n=1 Tax=Granulicella arctica TaxID=940613 RepID=UPI0021E09455|nr:nucleotidyltransferase family protein [Granulicella arctica]
MSVGAIILAAGASTRLGEPKQLISFSGELLLERTVRIAAEAGCEPVIVVLGASAETILTASNLGNAEIVINADWEDGMAESIVCGVAAIDGRVDAAVVLACDQPALTVSHLLALMQTNEVAASAYAGRRGVPAYFPAATFEDLMELQGDTGARDLLKTARTVDLPGGELDVDTPETLARARELYEVA